jgi:hypothetical protein
MVLAMIQYQQTEKDNLGIVPRTSMLFEIRKLADFAPHPQNPRSNGHRKEGLS